MIGNTILTSRRLIASIGAVAVTKQEQRQRHVRYRDPDKIRGDVIGGKVQGPSLESSRRSHHPEADGLGNQV